MTTNIEKRRVSKMPAWRPILSTMSSTKLDMKVSFNKVLYNEGLYPLHDMRTPMAPDSRRLNLLARAAAAHPTNLPKNATTQRRTTYPQVVPLSNKPKLVFNPERAKY